MSIDTYLQLFKKMSGSVPFLLLLCAKPVHQKYIQHIIFFKAASGYAQPLTDFLPVGLTLALIYLKRY